MERRFVSLAAVGILCGFVCTSARPLEAKKIGKDEAIEIAKNTKEASSFLEKFGRVANCRLKEDVPSSPTTPILGCVVIDFFEACSNADRGCDDSWTVEFFVSWACEAAHAKEIAGLVTAGVAIKIDKATGKARPVDPRIEFDRAGQRCKTDADCVCLSGGGVPFLGCANTVRGAGWFAGSYECDRCKCTDNLCR